MKVSIITVAYNSAATIGSTIESVMRQSHPDIEYIIIDGASSDDTLAIVNEYRSRIARIVSEPDKGLYDAMNKGIALATGDVIGILNSDDFFETEDVLATVAKTFEANPRAQLAFGDIVFVEDPDLDTVTRYYGAAHFRPWKLRFGWMPPHPATFIRREAYESVGKYATHYRISADYDMFIRLLLVHKLSWARIDSVLVRMRTGGASTSGLRSSLKLNMEIVDACRRNGIYTNLAMVLSKLPFKLLEYIKHPTGISR